MSVKIDIGALFPAHLRELFKETSKLSDRLREIRLRSGLPIIIVLSDGEYFLSKRGELIRAKEGARVTAAEDVEAVLSHLCSYSVYAFEEQLKQGFFTVTGGHRIGVVGQAVLNDGSIRTLKHISGLNMRISHQVKGHAEEIIPLLCTSGEINNTLIISSPGCGKTTLLRELIRQLSNGGDFGHGVSVGVVDERSEIAGCFMGKSANDLGIRTDVLDAAPKADGIMMLVRSMSPKVIAVDEIDSDNDMKAVLGAVFSGCKVLATIHGAELSDIREKPLFKAVWEKGVFERYIVLGNRGGAGRIKGVYGAKGELIGKERRY